MKSVAQEKDENSIAYISGICTRNNYLGDPIIDGRIFKLKLVKLIEGWIQLAQNEDRWQFHINMIMNVSVP
jgi:hypothetical protein